MYFTQDGDDAALAGRTASGDLSAFEVLVHRYERVLFGVALRILGDREDAKDATQAAFIKAYRAIGSFDPRFRFFSWIYRILLNECLNTKRGRRAHEPLDLALAAPEGPLDALEAAERRRRVQAALMALPLEFREVVVLRHFAGLAYEDIASTLGIPATTVKSRLYTARQRLVALLLEKENAT